MTLPEHYILPQAVAELEEAITWYEHRQAGLGADLLEEYEALLDRALRSPRAGTPIVTADGFPMRRYRLKRFNRYAIIMSTVRGLPTVVAFEHSSREPNYWAARG